MSPWNGGAGVRPRALWPSRRSLCADKVNWRVDFALTRRKGWNGVWMSLACANKPGRLFSASLLWRGDVRGQLAGSAWAWKSTTCFARPFYRVTEGHSLLISASGLTPCSLGAKSTDTNKRLYAALAVLEAMPMRLELVCICQSMALGLQTRP